ncbi:MAG TPA: FAD-dependent oxidoreductase [Gemmatimonadales bacterium]|jgi:glycine/D-amino acid oxidase-like deaminating enzyme|nr:FAD-dependent oxidoreductase [Gemmatimonadales bacterium]
MTVSRAPDVIVVGAGLVGTMTALGLAEAGLQVTLIDHDFPGAGSTGAAMGHIVVMDDTPAQLALCAHSRTRWNALSETLPADGEHDHCGTLWLATDGDELAAATSRVAGYAASGVRAELLDAAALREAEPHLRHDLAGALSVPDDSVCYPPAIARDLAQRAAERGAVLRFGAMVTAIEPGGVRLAGNERIAAGAVVVAGGATSPQLIPALPIVPRRGHLVITDRRPGMVRHQLVELGYLHSAHTFGGASVAFNVQPRRTGQLLIGSSRELVGFKSGINRRLLAAMLERAGTFVPALREARALRTWTGFRPATPDKLPLIGAWPAIPGVWIAAGHEGLGITMAPGTADIVIAGILGSSSPVDPAPFRPDRPMPTMAEAA